MTVNKICRFVSEDDTPCGELRYGSQDYCIEHYNEIIMQDETPVEMQAPSDYLQAIPPMVTTVAQVRDVLGIMIPQLLAGRVDPKVMTALTGACLAQAKIVELSDIEEKLRQLENIVDTDIRSTYVLDD
jgi:hypothetical protein